MLRWPSHSREHVATEGENLAGVYSPLLVCASANEEAALKFVDLLGEHSILCDWKRPGFSREGKIIASLCLDLNVSLCLSSSLATIKLPGSPLL